MLRSAKLRRLTTVAAAAVLAALLAVVLWGAKPAGAAFPGANGKIVFSSDRTEGEGVDNPTGDSEIFAMNPDGTELEQLTFNTAAEVHPTWSPRGNAIAFASYRDGNSEIYLMFYGGPFHGFEARLTNNPTTDENPTFNHDGTKIAFSTHRDGDYDIFVMNADGTEQKRRTKKAADDFRPAWSPDGKKIAFGSTRRGGTDDEIYVMKAAKPEGKKNRPKNLTKNDVVDDFGPDWQPIPSP